MIRCRRFDSFRQNRLHCFGFRNLRRVAFVRSAPRAHVLAVLAPLANLFRSLARIDHADDRRKAARGASRTGRRRGRSRGATQSFRGIKWRALLASCGVFAPGRWPAFATPPMPLAGPTIPHPLLGHQSARPYFCAFRSSPSVSEICVLAFAPIIAGGAQPKSRGNAPCLDSGRGYHGIGAKRFKTRPPLPGCVAVLRTRPRASNDSEAFHFLLIISLSVLPPVANSSWSPLRRAHSGR